MPSARPEDVNRRTDKVTRLDVTTQRPVIDEEASGEVEKQASWPHQRELLLAKHVGVAGSAVNVQRDDVSG